MNCANHPDIEKVAFCRTCGKPLCANCTRSVNGVIYCESCLAARLEGVQPNVAAPVSGFVPTIPGTAPMVGGPNPALAGVLAGFFPFGVGAVYTGQYAKGLAHSGGERLDVSKAPVGALVLIGLGVIFLLHTLDIWDFSAHRVWPLVLIAIGGFLLARRLGWIGEVAPGFDRASSRLTLGFQFLLDSMGVIRFGRTVPLLLVVIGLVKIFQSSGPGPIAGPPPSIPGGPPPYASGEVPPPYSEAKPEVKNG